MTDLERRALLGDAEAQRECTEKGITLPCPFCCGHAEIKTQKVEYGLSGTIIRCKKCMVQLYSPDEKAAPTSDWVRNIPVESHKEIGIGRWNARPAPPIGRCGECKHWYKQHCAHGPCATYPTDADFSCGGFEPKGGEENGRTAAD